MGKMLAFNLPNITLILCRNIPSKLAKTKILKTVLCFSFKQSGLNYLLLAFDEF
jgi:hypothetical protein